MMKLLFSDASPYARKCRITVREKQISDIEEIHVHPIDEPEKINHLNPLGKIPCLIYGEEQTLFDSPVICAYFDKIGTGPRLMHPDHPKYWQMRRHEAMANGILDAALLLVYERRKDKALQTPDWMQRWTHAIDRSLSQINNELDQIDGEISTPQIALGTAIGYLHFRLGHNDWLAPYHELTTWYNAFSKRSSMQATRPK